MAEWILRPAATVSRPDCTRLWRGDECYYLLEGEVTAFNAESGEAFVFRAGDAMLIPPHCTPRKACGTVEDSGSPLSSQGGDYRSALVTRYST
jgi:hypothetical protein